FDGGVPFHLRHMSSLTPQSISHRPCRNVSALYINDVVFSAILIKDKHTGFFIFTGDKIFDRNPYSPYNSKTYGKFI
ncbi:MAG: hypothetical protein KKA48_03505, partial [Proteobacteria bacterium]|nr:hypothetical protein [Pseudomonadota bacterium]